MCFTENYFYLLFFINNNMKTSIRINNVNIDVVIKLQRIVKPDLIK